MSDLTTQEQTNVRTALRFLRTRTGGWAPLAKVLRFNQATLANMMFGKRSRNVSASLAIRVARLAGVPIDDVLAGRYPAPGTCAHCGHRPDDADAGVNGEAAADAR